MMKKSADALIYLIVILLLITGMAVSAAGATVWNVSKNPVDGVHNVTGLVNITGKLTAGDTIRIRGEDGYVCEGGITVDKQDVTIKQWEGSPVRPVITNHTGKSAITITTTGDNATLLGLNISGNSKSSGSGAGVYASGSPDDPVEKITMEDCNVTHNFAEKYGGGCYLYSSSNATITDTTYTNNTAGENGGGCFFKSSSNATITDTTYTNNTAGENGGGCFFKSSSNATITGTTYTNNTASLFGGGCCFNSKCNNATITGTTYANNTANIGGGCCFYTGCNNATITGTTFANNTAKYNGGGCYLLGSSNATITDVIAQNNTASDISSTSSCTGISVDNLTLQYKNTTRVSFTFDGAMDISGDAAGGSDPAGCCNISHYVKVKAPGWMFLNVSYDDTDVVGLEPSSLAMWNYTGNKWSKVPGINGVNTVGKYVYANLSDLSEWNTLAPFAQLTGNLQVNSTPKGAKIYLNGTDTGKTTNSTLPNRPVGTYAVTLEKPGYEPAEQVVTVSRDVTATVDLTLTPVTLWNVSSIPGVGNYTNVLDIPSLKDGDTIRIWGTDGHVYEGGFTIAVANVTIKRWEGSPVRPVITNHTGKSAITITKTGDNTTLLGLNISGNSVSPSGAGVYAIGSSGNPVEKITMEDCNVTHNFANNCGGGCHLYNNCNNATITNTTFSNNTANYGGGCYLYDNCNNATITGTTFANNTANIHGGSCYLSYCSNATITGTTYSSSTANYGGGCLYTHCNNTTITGTTYANNTANYGGGCCFDSSSNATITGTTYSGSTANYGGGCYFGNSNDATITDVIAQNNTVSDISSASGCTGISVNNLTLQYKKSTRVSFTFDGNADISGEVAGVSDPAGCCNISHYVKVKAPGWIHLNVSYKDTDVAGLNSSSLSMWNYTGSGWNEVPGTNGVNTGEKYVYANLTGLNDWNVIAPLSNVTGELRINSSPEKGWIWLDGVNRSVQTNTTVREILPDVDHNVTVVLPGYHVGINESVNVSEYGVTDVFFGLVHETGDLQVNSSPDGAAIYLNGTLNSSVTNTTLNDLDTGTYNVMVNRVGFDSLSQEVVLSAGKITVVEFAFPRYSGGDGTAASPYRINTSEDIEELATISADWSGNYFRVGNEIILSAGQPSAQIGNSTIPFTGNFDGRGHTISNLTLAKSGIDYVGLFGYTGSGAAITDVSVETIDEGVRGNSFAGVLVGWNDAGSRITGCHAAGKVSSGMDNGGLVGHNDGDIENCSATTDVTGSDKHTGGLVGRNCGSISASYATGEVYAPNCANGGLVGWNNGGDIANCYATGNASGDIDDIGGLVGTNEHGGTIVNCYATGNANAAKVHAGGLVGLNRNGATITNSYATGTAVAANGECGGLLGSNQSSVFTNCYRHTGGDNCLGTLITDTTRFGDYAFLTGAEGSGLAWSPDIISTSEDSTKIWRVFASKSAYPQFQWEPVLTGTIRVTSVPQQGIIYFNGIATGEVTDHTFPAQPIGEYNVTIILDGYAPGINTSVHVEKGKTTDVSFDLVHETGGLQVNSNPDGAEIFLNGIDTNKVTNSVLSGLDTGTYSVTVILDGYAPGINTGVHVEKGKTTDVSFDLVHETGVLQINSNPDGAEIFLNGIDTSKVTNSVLSGLDIGVYNVTVLLDGYEPGINTGVHVEKGKTTDVSFDLVHETGVLQINSNPDGAEIYLNGIDTNKVTNSVLSGLDIGVYNVTVLLDDYEPGINTSVRVVKGKTPDVSFDLVHETGVLQVNSNPDGAEIFLNGIDTSKVTNRTLSNLDTGTYNVTVLLNDYEPGINTGVHVVKGETTGVSFDLIRETGVIQVNSTPAGAEIFLNGIDTNKVTNTTLSNLETGVYNVTVAKAGYGICFNTSVPVEKGKRTDVLFKLVHEIGSIQVSTSPDMADIYLDGKYTGKTTNDTLSSVPTGTHNVTVVKPGYFTVVNKSVTVTEGNITDVFSGMTEQTGNISVRSSPADAWIWLDGVNRSVQTNETVDNIPVGTHNITLVKPLYYNAANESVQVSLNRTTDVFFTLTATGSKPTPSFTADPLSGKAPLRVCFTDTSNCDPQEWNWSFGDGNYSTQQNPTHTYTKEGTYDVRLTAGNPYGSSTITEKDCVTVSGIPPIQLYAPTGRIPAGDTATFPVEADGLDNITELNFTISYDTALITVEGARLPADLECAGYDIETDHILGVVKVNINGLNAESTAPVLDITFQATDSITGLRETSALEITDADARKGSHECQVIRTDGAIDVEARTTIGAPDGTLPVESSKYLTVNVSNLNEVEDVLFLMEFNRTVMSVTDVRANNTLPGLAVDSVIRNDNGWLQVNVTSRDNITTEESLPIVDIEVHSNGLPCDRELRLVNILWTRNNATYSFDDMYPGYINITPVDVALRDEPPVSVENMTYDNVTKRIAINVSENRNATITDDNRTVVIKNSGIDITLHTSGMENKSFEWNGTCTGADIGNISNSVDLSGDVGGITANISFAELSGNLSRLTEPGTGLNITITRGAVNESVGRLFQCAVFDELGAELEEVAYTMEINKSALGGIAVSNATIVMTAPVLYVNNWGGPDNFRIISMSDDGVLSVLDTTYTREGDIFVFTALSPEGFSSKSLVSVTGTEDPVAEFSAIPVTGDAPLYVQFYDYSAGHPDSWSWDFGDRNMSVEQNPEHTYSSPGEYDVTLTITNVKGGNTCTKPGYITVNNQMKVDFVASRNSGCAPLTVSFTDRTTGNPDSWLWKFGDGQTSEEQNPEHTYRISGTYTVSLTAANEYGGVTAQKIGFITVFSNGGDGDDDDGDSTVMPTTTPTQATVIPTDTPTPEPTVTENPEPVGTATHAPVDNSTVQTGTPVATRAGDAPAGTWGGSLLWLWILIIIALVVAAVVVLNRREK